MSLTRYLKAAFLFHWNLLAFLGGSVFAFLSGYPDVILPLVAAAEVAYLGLLGTNPKFQSYVDREEHLARKMEGAEESGKTLSRIRSLLPRTHLDRFESLEARCRDLRQIARDLHESDTSDVSTSLDQMQLAGLDRLLWIYLRLLYTEWSLERFFMRTSEDSVKADIVRLEAKLAKLSGAPEKGSRQKKRKAIEDNLETSRARLRNLEQARENHELIELEIDRLENKIRTLSEIAVSRQEPEFISDQVDAVASSMLETERTMNDLKFATGLSTVEESVPDILRAEPESMPESMEENRTRPGPIEREKDRR